MDIKDCVFKKSLDIYVIRIDNHGLLSIAKPCCECVFLLSVYRKIYYSDHKGNIICENANSITNDHVSSGYRRIKK